MVCTSGLVNDVILPIVGQAKATKIDYRRLFKLTHQGAAPDHTTTGGIRCLRLPSMPCFKSGVL